MNLYVKATIPRTRYSGAIPTDRELVQQADVCPLCRSPLVKGHGWVSCPRIGHYTKVGATDAPLGDTLTGMPEKP
jgi:hypothetical protein